MKTFSVPEVFGCRGIEDERVGPRLGHHDVHVRVSAGEYTVSQRPTVGLGRRQDVEGAEQAATAAAIHEIEAQGLPGRRRELDFPICPRTGEVLRLAIVDVPPGAIVAPTTGSEIVTCTSTARAAEPTDFCTTIA